LRQRLTIAAAIVFFLLAAGAGVAAIEAYHATQIANTQTKLAEKQTQVAQQQRQAAIQAQQQAGTERDIALTTQANLLAVQSEQLIGQGDIQTAILLSLEALRPPDDTGPDRYNVQVEQTLLKALYLNPLRAILRAGTSKYVDAAFVYDASTLVTVAENGSVAFWNVDSGGRIPGQTGLTVPFGGVSAVFVDPARPILLFRGQDKTFTAWNYQTRQTVAGVTGRCNEDSAQFAFDPTGTRLFVYCSDVTIFDLATGHATRVSGKFDKFALAPNGKLFVASADANVTVFDAASAAVVTNWRQPDSVQGLAMNYDGTMVLTQNYDGIRFYSSKNGRVAATLLKTSQARTFDIMASPAANVVVAGGDIGSQVWNIDRAAPIQLLADLNSGAVSFLPNGYLVSSDGDSKMSLWEYTVEGHTGTREAVDHADLYVDGGHTFMGNSLDSKKIVTLSKAGDLYVWSSDPAMLLSAVADNGERLGDPAAISADGKVVVTTSAGATDGNDKPTAPTGVITVWDAATLKPTSQVRPPKPPAVLAISGDGRRIVYVDADDNYDILDATTLKSIKPTGLPRLVYSAALSADGQTVALGYSKGFSLWRIDGGANVKECSVAGNVGGVIFTDKGTIAYAMDDGSVYLLAPDNCDSQQIFAFTVDKSSNDPADADIRSKQGLISGYLFSRLQLWNESQGKKTFDQTRAQWPVFDTSGAEETIVDIVTGQRLIVGKQVDTNLHIYDLSDPNKPVEILSFTADTGDCCAPVDVVTLPGGDGLMTQWSERGAYRLRTWRLLPTIAEATALAKSLVPECLSPQARQNRGLEPNPPPWCIEMNKRPYDTPQWRQWLAAKQAGKSPPLPPAN
jgi:WD40 repeat protein